MFTPILEKNETDLIISGKSNEKTKVVVAMSGGVDSSVAASLIKELGYDVVGITLQLFDYGKIGKTRGTCCAGKDIYDAKKVCDQIKIDHKVMNYENIFNEYYGKDKITELKLPKPPKVLPVPEHWNTLLPIEERMKQFSKDLLHW